MLERKTRVKRREYIDGRDEVKAVEQHHMVVHYGEKNDRRDGSSSRK
jgi:hypothetical protein